VAVFVRAECLLRVLKTLAPFSLITARKTSKPMAHSWELLRDRY
jgi:hypothetical protein